MKIGEIIGAAIKVGVMTAFQSVGESGLKRVLDTAAKMPSGMGLAAKIISTEIGTPTTTGEAFARNMASSGLMEKAAAIRSQADNPMIDYSKHPSKMMTGEQLQQMLNELRGINQKLSPQP